MNRILVVLALGLGLIAGHVVSSPAAPTIKGGGGVSGTCATSNRLARFTSAFGLGCSLLSDDASNVTLTTGTFRGPNGGASAPTYSFTSGPTDGFYWAQAADVRLGLSGTLAFAFNTTTFTMNSNSAMISMGSASDMNISRAAAGELTYTAVAFASLGTPANGTSAYCSDCKVTTGTPGNPSTISNNTCTSAGNGAWALRLNGVWVCVQ